MITGRVRAPEISSKHDWLNADINYSLKDFRGKIVLLDFWTLGCINCQHILPDLKKLEQEYPTELVVIGVHSGKFDAEKNQHSIRKAILKYGIEHPVINDADFEIWRQYAINAWPTVVLIDPDGNVIGQKAGEGVYDVVKPNLEGLKKDFAAKLNPAIFPFQREHETILNTPLRFPGKMVVAEDNTFFLSDSGHNRILHLNPDGEVLDIIGTGEEGFVNGNFTEATFNQPQGLALRGHILYVADTRNHAIRLIDLVEKVVLTAAGTGEMGYYFNQDKYDEPVNPNSPWDLALAGEVMYIANAGNHQVLRMDLRTETVWRFAGTGREALVNGPLRECSFNQPSGLALAGNFLYVADAEASAIRVIDLAAGTVNTLVGHGLFDFGDLDGAAQVAQLQHAVGIISLGSNLYIADTYNGKIKVLDLERKRVKTLVGGLDEPNDVKFINGFMWVTDTNHHQLLKINLETGEKHLVPILMK